MGGARTDLEKADVPFPDERGRRIDCHGNTIVGFVNPMNALAIQITTKANLNSALGLANA